MSVKTMLWSVKDMVGIEYIEKTRDYLDYLENHLNNIAKAFNLVEEKCSRMKFIYDDFEYWKLRQEVEKHDLSKFSSKEFTQYRDKFFPTSNEKNNFDVEISFNEAWEHHKKNNDHHFGCDKNFNPAHMAIDLIAMSFKFNDNPKEFYLTKERLENETDHNFIMEIFEKCGY